MGLSTHIVVEAAIDSFGDAQRAVREGAARLEVCGDLSVGGVTPSVALLRDSLTLGVPCVAMVRPRAGAFVYDAAELRALRDDARIMLDAGAHGIVFGCLNADLTVAEVATRELVALAPRAETVFHRAFDDTPDAHAALDALVRAGVTRILTSGHAATALEGAAEIGALVVRAAGRIEILPGGTVRANNVRELVAATGVHQVHARASAPHVIAALVAALASATSSP